MQSIINAIIVACVLLLSLPAHAVQSAVVFMYHHFGDSRYPSTNVRLAQFDAQLNFLETAGFQVWSLQDILASLATDRPLPDKVVAITMDDAYLSVYTEAYPRLKQRNWPFTVFVSTDYIDRRLPNYMSWAQMREMQHHGAQYGNHSTGHAHLIRKRPGETDQQWQQRIRQDIDHAHRRLHDALSQVLPYFAYPYGEYDLTLAQLIADAGLTGFGQHSGALGEHSDRRILPRFPINETYGDLPGFSTKALSLALPVAPHPATNPVITQSRPQLNVTLAEPIERPKQLACYAGAQGVMDVQWLDDDKHRFSVQASADLPLGRSRYNCTAPSNIPGRYYWFSQLWIRPAAGL